MMWSERHRPAEIGAMVGNEDARAEIVKWLSSWAPGTRPLLLVGPPGTGKTTSATLACGAFGYDMIGMNASDARGRTRIAKMLEPAMGNASIAGRAMIFIDEVDGIHGRADFGGAEALIKLIKEPTVPIILAANSGASAKMKGLAKVAKTVPFRQLPPRLLRVYLRRVLREEGASLSPGAEIRVISESRGDLRSMINIAQALATGHDAHAERAPVQLDAETAVNAFFAAPSASEAAAALRAMKSDPRDKIGAFYSSVITARGLPAAEAARMMEVLSRADMLYGRIMRTQQWRLLRYLDAILAGLYSEKSPVRYAQYNVPWPLLNRMRFDGRALRAACAAMGAAAHVSGSAFSTLYLPHMVARAANGEEQDPALARAAGEGLGDVLAKESERLKKGRRAG